MISFKRIKESFVKVITVSCVNEKCELSTLKVLVTKNK